MAKIQSRTEFASAINQICAERGIEPEVVIETIKSAILAAYRKEYIAESQEDENLEDTLEVELDSETGAAKIFKINKDDKKEDITPPGFGRIATQTAKQVILQRVREAEKDAIIEEYKDKVETMITGMVLRFDGKNVIYDIGRGQAYMPPEDQIPTEFYKMNQRMAVYIKDIRETMRGKTIIVSRSVPELVVELFNREVPEVSSGAVEIEAISREAGYRTKIAVESTQDGVDPVGSCVGQKGVRVQEVINELNNEKIDIIQYSDDPDMFIASALAPAENLSIKINEKKKSAVVTVPDDQLSLAIGKGGQNVRLAAKLTGYKIDIKGTAVSSTGEKEFEIDELALDEEIRDALVGAKITTFEAVFNKKDQLTEMDEVGEKAVKDIIKQIDKFNSSLNEIIKESQESDNEDEVDSDQETQKKDKQKDKKEESKKVKKSDDQKKSQDEEKKKESDDSDQDKDDKDQEKKE